MTQHYCVHVHAPRYLQPSRAPSTSRRDFRAHASTSARPGVGLALGQCSRQIDVALSITQPCLQKAALYNPFAALSSSLKYESTCQMCESRKG